MRIVLAREGMNSWSCSLKRTVEMADEAGVGKFADVPLFTIGSPNPCNANITTWPLCIITGYYYTHKAA